MTIIQCPKAPWYTDDIRVQKTIRRNFERCWCRSGLATDRQSYADQCLLVENLIFKAKINYYSDLINDAGADNNALFRSIDRLLRRKPEKRFPSCSSSKELSNKNKDKIINIRSQLGTPELPDHFRLLDIPTLNCQLDIFSPTSLNHEVFGNFRPISNLKVVSKIIIWNSIILMNLYNLPTTISQL